MVVTDIERESLSSYSGKSDLDEKYVQESPNETHLKVVLWEIGKMLDFNKFFSPKKIALSKKNTVQVLVIKICEYLSIIYALHGKLVQQIEHLASEN